MSVVSLLGVEVLNNPAKFTDKYEFEITFECLEPLEKELDSLLVGPIPVGVSKFPFEAEAPDTKRIPDSDILGVTVILLTCAYDGREFVRPIIERVKRNILAEKPRVTRFAIKWDSEASAPAEFPPEQPEADLVADEDEYGAEEAEEEEAEVEAEVNGEDAAGDANMADADAEGAAKEEDELSDDGSVDIEGESEDEEEGEEEAEEGDAMDEDAMEVDEGAKASGPKAAEVVMSH
ncbi:unnamed protein product [Parascedosporium putredinis]|uniref:Anti-silencing function protein 1 n=1 Tax=Parascedosporium putredinis TaxID=1442378 RepID=A0A9P1H9W2_9PEZI|nr:unnamed protein product [Parascedosporium putredinis]CAI8003988.1 unnamed protein product [Parascedosporium putredinis]